MILTMLAASISLNGGWGFAFNEDARLESARADFTVTDTMTVPGCWDVQPKWYLKHGTGLYRRTFTLDAPLSDGVLVVEGMGVRARFEIDGRDLGTRVTPYARLEIPVGKLSAGDHTIFAAVDNVMTWPEVKLARPYYDFYFYGGFYHGIKLVEREQKVFVRTVDYRTGTIEIRMDGECVSANRTVVFDGVNRAQAEFLNGRATVRVPHFKIWSPDNPNLHSLRVQSSTSGNQPATCTPQVRFGIRQIEAKKGKIYLNGEELFLKGFNRHESTYFEGAATTDQTMLRDLQHLKALGGNFIRGAHYQQSERFLDLCDELGVLVWEESLGWGNGQGYTNGRYPPCEPDDGEFCRLQVDQTRDMVRASFNHPSVIIYAFLNECNSAKQSVRRLVDSLVKTIRDEDSGRLITFATCTIEKDICCSNLDMIAFNAYPGTIPAAPGTPSEFRTKVHQRFDEIVRIFRERYPDKPIMVSESGCGGMYGVHDPNASVNTEEYQEEYLRYIMETLWANPDVVGYSIWQMNDGRTRERFSSKSCSAVFGGSIAGCFDRERRPKLSVKTIRKFFGKK